LGITLVLAVLYFVPLLVAVARNHNAGSVGIVNLLLGWTFIGWIIALVMACGNQKQQVTVIQQAAPTGQLPTGQRAPDHAGFCSNCGSPLHADASFCPTCGAAVVPRR